MSEYASVLITFFDGDSFYKIAIKVLHSWELDDAVKYYAMPESKLYINSLLPSHLRGDYIASAEYIFDVVLGE